MKRGIIIYGKITTSNGEAIAANKLTPCVTPKISANGNLDFDAYLMFRNFWHYTKMKFKPVLLLLYSLLSLLISGRIFNKIIFIYS